MPDLVAIGPGRGPTALITAGIFAGIAAAGCGRSAPSRHDVQGRVSGDGLPVPAGFVVFSPDVAGGGTRLQGAALIRDGRTARPAPMGGG